MYFLKKKFVQHLWTNIYGQTYGQTDSTSEIGALGYSCIIVWH